VSDLSPFDKKVLDAMPIGENLIPSEIGLCVWPDKYRKPQGAARMAGRFLKRLKDKGYVENISIEHFRTGIVWWYWRRIK